MMSRSVVRLEHAGRTVNPSGTLSVMGLGAAAGSSVTIHAEGPDAAYATRVLAEMLQEIDRSASRMAVRSRTWQ